jgi:hypothetical protein
MTQTQVQVVEGKVQTGLLGSSSDACRQVIELVFATPTLGINDLEKKLSNAQGQAVCVQMSIAILLSEMKNRWDVRNQPGHEDFRTFFCTYENFQDYCKQAWGYAETRCKQFVKIGRTLVELMCEAQSQEKTFILPASVTEAINLARLPDDSRLDVWQAYKYDGVPLPIADSANKQQESIQDSDLTDLPASSNPQAIHIQTFREIADILPQNDLTAVIASMINPWNKDVIMDLFAKKPARADLATMGIRAKHDLANTYQVTGFHGLIGQDLDDFLTEKLNLI